MRVLVLEDDDNLRKAIVRYSYRHARHVDEASDALDAVNHIMENPPDVLIADWDLGEDLTGVDVAKIVHKQSPTVRIAMITGKPMKQLKSAAKHVPVHIFLAKPFSLNEILAIFE